MHGRMGPFLVIHFTWAFNKNLFSSLYDAVYGDNGLNIGDKLVELGHASVAQMTLVNLDNDQTTIAADTVGRVIMINTTS